MNKIYLNTIGTPCKAGGGGGTPINNQEKSVDITENGTIEVFADAGFTGLGKITINVNVPTGTPTYENGVYIQHIDGKLYTEQEWTSGGFGGNDANGVAVITDNARFVIAKAELGDFAWASADVTLVDGITTTTDETTATADFAGCNNTQMMLATDTSGAGYSCANFTFPNGSKGYLPALGEWKEASAYKSEINFVMATIGGTEMYRSYHWSSTQKSNSSSWVWHWNHEVTSTYSKTTKITVRAFTTLD